MNTSIKKYPTCGHTHTTIDATLSLVEAHEIDPREIEEVSIETYSDAVDKAGEVSQ